LFDFTNGFTNWGWNQLHLMALFAQHTSEEVRPGTCFHPDQGSLQVGGKSDELLLGELLPQQHLACCVQGYDVKSRLA
jgi:hypothetical protein